MSTNQQALLAAWKAACKVPGATVEIPSEFKFLVKPLTLQGPCMPNLVFQVCFLFFLADLPHPDSQKVFYLKRNKNGKKYILCQILILSLFTLKCPMHEANPDGIPTDRWSSVSPPKSGFMAKVQFVSMDKLQMDP